MAQPKTAAWTKMLVQVGDGAMPTETFSQPCALVSRGFSFSATASQSVVPDCDNPDLPAWVQRVVNELSAGISGSGVLALAAHAIFRAWFLAGISRNVRIKIDVPLADGGGSYQGAFVLTKFELTGNRADGKVNVSVSMDSDGPVTWVAASV